MCNIEDVPYNPNSIFTQLSSCFARRDDLFRRETIQRFRARIIPHSETYRNVLAWTSIIGNEVVSMKNIIPRMNAGRLNYAAILIILQNANAWDKFLRNYMILLRYENLEKMYAKIFFLNRRHNQFRWNTTGFSEKTSK